MPQCVYEVKCTCDLIKIVVKYKDYGYVFCFLKGLDDTYTIDKTQVLLLNPLSDINKVFNKKDS